MMNSSARMLPLLMGVAALLSACTTLLDGRYDYRDGWRAGRIIAVMPGVAVERPHYWACVREVPAAERMATRYALVAYRVTGRASRQRLVPLVPGVDLVPGESVLVNLAHCEGAVVRRAASPATHADPAPGGGFSAAHFDKMTHVGRLASTATSSQPSTLTDVNRSGPPTAHTRSGEGRMPPHDHQATIAQ